MSNAVSRADNGLIVRKMRERRHGKVDGHDVAWADEVEHVTAQDRDDALDAAADFVVKKQHLMEVCAHKVALHDGK